ncbi:Acyl-CoA dehydrogenase, C-terminal domain [Sphingopyxis flava]|uniref:Acyl-CoA dehydrogenase, C-terminal domain n=2 Tax=Sphingopyxis flava TaxID=1507287 RepID=A0A1T5FTZ2_9SPHN|nr:Acyl-CoA dehydrogenase, C-terminal domain [Sphingopyxis flava]
MMAANVATASAAAFLPDAGYQAIFGNSRPIIAGAGAPMGRADVEGDGYRLTGHWTYGSGCLHADYIHAGAMVYENGAPRLIPGTKDPEVRIFVFPASDTKMLGNWDVLGLRGTGSIDYAVSDLFVPGEFTHLPTGLEGKRGGDSYRIGVVGFSALGHTGFALGHGRRILDELGELVHAPSGHPTILSGMAGSDSFKEGYSAAQGKIRAARALCYDIWGDILDTTSRGEPVPLRQMTWARVALCHATTAMMEVSIFAHRASGGVGLRAGTLQRLLRDNFTATQHLMVADKALCESGRDFLGLVDNVRWTPRGFVNVN